MLNTELNSSVKDVVLDKIYTMMPDTTDFDELPDIQTSSSAPVGGKQGNNPRLTRQTSKQVAEIQAKKRIKKQGQFINILTKFVGLDNTTFQTHKEWALWSS